MSVFGTAVCGMKKNEKEALTNDKLNYINITDIAEQTTLQANVQVNTYVNGIGFCDMMKFLMECKADISSFNTMIVDNDMKFSEEELWVGMANYCPWCGRVIEWNKKED